MATAPGLYAARLDVDYPEKLDRFTSFFRLIWIIPIGIVLAFLNSTGNETVVEAGEQVERTGGGISGGLFAATMLMIVFRARYPRWWFDFARELTRFGARVSAYFFFSRTSTPRPSTSSPCISRSTTPTSSET